MLYSCVPEEVVRPAEPGTEATSVNAVKLDESIPISAVSPEPRRPDVEPMYLRGVEQHAGGGPWRDAIGQLREAGLSVPQIMHLFAFKPDRTRHLAAFTQDVMRGASPLSPGQRELIAAFTSRRNACPF